MPAHVNVNRRTLATIVAIAACTLAVGAARAQSIEPRAFSNTPVGMNFLIAGYGYTRGSLEFDTAVPITDANLHTSNTILAYVRALDVLGTSGKFDVIVPYTWLSGSAQYAGAPIERVVDGMADPAFRLSVNLYGAPAMTLEEFRGYQQDLIVGASLQVTAPLGQYDDQRIVNIGAHRWTLKPQVGVSKAVGAWTLEATAAGTFFTDNRDFYGGKLRAQAPLYSIQGHVIYSFPSGIWASLDATYFTGGRTTIDGAQNADLQRNWRTGGTLALPVDVHNSVKLYASRGVSARTGNNFDLVGIAWQYRWGAGL